MASGQRDGITILLGLKWYEVGEISEDGKGIELLRAYSRVTRQAEQEALWQLKEQSFSQVRRGSGVEYAILCCLFERQIGEEALGPIVEEIPGH